MEGGSYEYRARQASGGNTTQASRVVVTNTVGWTLQVGQPPIPSPTPASSENSANNSNNLNSQLAQGIMSEEAEGNLPAAMSQYEKLIIQFDQSRAAAANALFRLAEGHRKLGQNEEAKIAYSRVLREFPDFEQLASLSHKGFLACNKAVAQKPATPPENPPSSDPTTEQASATGVPSEKTLDPESLRALDRDRLFASQNYAQLNTLYLNLKKMSPEDLRRAMPVAWPDEALSRYLQTLAKAQQDLAQARNNLGDEHPSVKDLKTLIKTVDGQIDDRIEGVLRGIEVRVNAARTVSDDLQKRLDQSTTANTTTSAQQPTPPVIISAQKNGTNWWFGRDLPISSPRWNRLISDYFTNNPSKPLEVWIRKWPSTSNDELESISNKVQNAGPVKLTVVNCVERMDEQIRQLTANVINTIDRFDQAEELLNQLRNTDAKYLPNSALLGTSSTPVVTPLYKELIQEYEAAVVAADGSTAAKEKLRTAVDKLERYKQNIILNAFVRRRDSRTQDLVNAAAELTKALAAETSAQGSEPIPEDPTTKIPANPRHGSPDGSPSYGVNVPLLIDLHSDGTATIDTNRYAAKELETYLRSLLNSPRSPGDNQRFYLRKGPQSSQEQVERLVEIMAGKSGPGGNMSVGQGIERLDADIQAAQQSIADAAKLASDRDKKYIRVREADSRYLPSEFATSAYAKLQDQYAKALSSNDASAAAMARVETALGQLVDYKEKVVLAELRPQVDRAYQDLYKAKSRLLELLAREQTAQVQVPKTENPNTK